MKSHHFRPTRSCLLLDPLVVSCHQDKVKVLTGRKPLQNVRDQTLAEQAVKGLSGEA